MALAREVLAAIDSGTQHTVMKRASQPNYWIYDRIEVDYGYGRTHS
jgi:hypothetical protein